MLGLLGRNVGLGVGGGARAGMLATVPGFVEMAGGPVVPDELDDDELADGALGVDALVAGGPGGFFGLVGELNDMSSGSS